MLDIIDIPGIPMGVGIKLNELRIDWYFEETRIKC